MQYPGDMSEPASTKADLQTLKALQADAPELERIENLLDRELVSTVRANAAALRKRLLPALRSNTACSRPKTSILASGRYDAPFCVRHADADRG